MGLADNFLKSKAWRESRGRMTPKDEVVKPLKSAGGRGYRVLDAGHGAAWNRLNAILAGRGSGYSMGFRG